MKNSFPLSARKIVIAGLMVLSVSASHFLGFLSSFPEGFQRLVATSFGVEFTGIFLYYVALASLGARLGAYIFFAIRAMPLIARRVRKIRIASGRRRYLSSALRTRNAVEFIPWLAFPIVLASLYATMTWLFTVLGCLVVAVLFVIPIRLPHLVLSPSRFWERLTSRRRVHFTLEYGGEALLLLASFFVALAFFLGQSRFARLAEADPTSFISQNYSGTAIILARTNDTTLVLEKSAESDDKRFLLIHKDFVASETMPAKSDRFKYLPAPAVTGK